MAVRVIYQGGEKIHIECSSIDSPAREKILSNLEAANVPFETNGCDFFVNADQFSSTGDFEEKVFSGFTQTLDLSLAFSHVGDAEEMQFCYLRVVPEEKRKEIEVVVQSLRAVNLDELKIRIDILKAMIADVSVDKPTKGNALKELEEKTRILKIITSPLFPWDIEQKMWSDAATAEVDSKELLDKHYDCSNAPNDTSAPCPRM